MNSQTKTNVIVSQTETVKGKRGRPAGAKNVPKLDSEGNVIPLKKDLIAANYVPKKRGRPPGSKNDTFQPKTSTVEIVEIVVSQIDTVLPLGINVAL
jgi:hypothetical protein